MKDPKERMGDVIDKLTNENAELKAELKEYRSGVGRQIAMAEIAELKDRIRELEAENERLESTVGTYRRTYNEGWK